MRNLINFILKNVHWLLFFLLLFLSVFLIVKNNQFQRSKYLSVVQDVAGRVYTISNTVESYMNLKTTNDDLLKRVADMEMQIQRYQNQLHLLNDSTKESRIELDSTSSITYRYIPARVIRNQIVGVKNYITLDKGSKDGVAPDMGVLSPNGNGVVGVIMSVSPNFSIIIPLLNSEFRLSCKLKRNNYPGLLVWDGHDPKYTYLEGLPRHETFQVGDTVVTSGNSDFFPAGIPVGVIAELSSPDNENDNILKVKLFTDFRGLSGALIVNNGFKEEQLQLERRISK